MTQIPDIVPARELALESALRSAISFLNPDSLDEIEHFVLGLAHAALALPPDGVNADMLAALQYVDSAAPDDDSDGEPIQITVTPEGLRQIRAAIKRAGG